MNQRWKHNLFISASIVGIVGWLFLISLWGWWTLQPTRLPEVKEPMPILNLNNEVAIGDDLIVKLSVTKLTEYVPIAASRFLSCKSGNLVTLTGTPINLPIGVYDIISKDITIPAKIAPGDVCVYEIDITWSINPIRDETEQFKSESFTILEKA